MENYEQKYKEALGRANAKIETYNHLGNASVVKSICEIFPELKESEDERIRKRIIEFLSTPFVKKGMSEGALSTWIAWLKKQGKKIDAIENFDTEFEKQVSHLIASAINKEYEYTSDFVKWTANVLLNYAKHELEKQGKIKRSDYPYIPGWRENRPDNKPKINHSILMLTTHGVAEGEWLGGKWCQYRWSCKIKDTEVLYWLNLSDLKTLEKENVKQGEHESQGKSALEVWKDMRLEVYQQASGNRHEPNYSDDSTKMFSLTDIDEIFEKVAEKQGEQKNAEWSEEDEEMVDAIIADIYFTQEAHNNEANHVIYEREIDWLKAIKERYTWKPSKEQIIALRWILNNIPYCKHKEEISGLLDQIKNL